MPIVGWRTARIGKCSNSRSSANFAASTALRQSRRPQSTTLTTKTSFPCGLSRSGLLRQKPRRRASGYGGNDSRRLRTAGLTTAACVPLALLAHVGSEATTATGKRSLLSVGRVPLPSRTVSAKLVTGSWPAIPCVESVSTGIAWHPNSGRCEVECHDPTSDPAKSPDRGVPRTSGHAVRSDGMDRDRGSRTVAYGLRDLDGPCA
jgi:hypothetical protein